MKNFNFKLDGVLKLRKFKEHKAKVELGMINREIEEIKREMKKLNKDIETGYDSQQELLSKGVKAKMIHFFPLFNKGKSEHIRLLQKRLDELEEEYEEQLELVIKLKGEADLIKKLKEKKKEIFIKKEQQKELEKQQELYMMGRHLKDNR